MPTTTTTTAPCGCTHSEAHDEKGELLYTDETLCREHTWKIWNELGTATTRTAHVTTHTIELTTKQQARMKELMEAQDNEQ